MPNRLKQIREMRGLGVTETASKLGVGRDQIHRLERANRQLTENWARRLAEVYEVAPRDLMSDSGLSVLIKYLCVKKIERGVENKAVVIEPPSRYVEVPGFVMQPEQCFGFFIGDDHANRLYPAGTSGMGRPLHFLNRPLKRGDKVVVRHFKRTRREGEVAETLVGVLDRAINGDLMLLLQTDNRSFGGAVTLRQARRDDPPATGDTIDYVPADDDFGEIVGVPVVAIIPQ